MKAIITPFAQMQAGIAVFKADPDTLMLLQRGKRFVIEPVQREMQDKLPDGLLVANQPLAAVKDLAPFFNDEQVMEAAGGKAGFRAWLKRGGDKCQSPDDSYHSPGSSVSPFGDSMARMCWHHDNHYRDEGHGEIEALLQENRALFILERVVRELLIPEGRDVSIPELCWWATLRGVHHALTEELCRISLARPRDEIDTGTLYESDITPSETAAEIVNRMAGKVSHMRMDPDPGAAYMRNPKAQLFRSKAFIDFTLTRPCCGCNKKAEYAYQAEHRLLDRHDVFVIPMCDYCYKQHRKDPNGWVSLYGSLLSHWMKHFNYAMNIGAISCE